MSEYSGLIDEVVSGERGAAAAQTVSSVDDNPDQAARALTLAKASGVPANAIYGDLETFERNNKASIASEIVRNNAQLERYVLADPLHAKLSNDDYGNLDEVSGKVTSLGDDSVMGAVAKAVKRSALLSPYTGATATALGAGYEGVREVGEAAAAGAAEGMFDLGEVRKYAPQLVRLMSSPLGLGLGINAASTDLTARLFNAGTYAAAAGISVYAKQLGMSEFDAARLTRDVIQGIQVNTAGPTFAAPHIAVTPVQVAEARRFAQSVAPYIEDGREPPVGLHPVVDQIKAEQAKTDIGLLDAALREAQNSTTRERNPEVFGSFIRQHSNAKIGISADAVQLLYGDKVPTPDDGKLGWAPRIEDQLRTAIETGTDVEIPLADWLANVEPDIQRALKDDIRVRPGGVTLNEAKLAEGLDLRAETPTEAIRATSALEPMFALGDRKVNLAKVDQFRFAHPEGERVVNSFDIHDERGKAVGMVDITEENGGKTLYVENIQSYLSMRGARDFGPKLVRDLLRQIKEQFPNAEELTGFRVSGARDKAGAVETKGKTSIKFNLSDENVAAVQAALRDGEWQALTPDTEAYVRPRELYTENETAILDAAAEVMQRIVPTAQGFDADRISNTSRPGQKILGLHVQYTDRLPIIAWAIGEENPLGTIRHEAIHHLYREGFFTSDEWGLLRKSALEGKWLEKYDINARYPELRPMDKLEEAIAEAYKDWATGKDTPKALHPIFEKLKALLTQIREAVAKVLGREPTWEDLFEAVEKGEVGQREGVKPRTKGAYAEARETQLPLGGDQLTRMEDREVFAQASAIGMTVDQYRRYMRLIEKRQAEDLAKATERATRDERRRQSAEWKAAEAEIRPEVAADINNRPDVAADNFFKSGELYGEKLSQRPKLNPELLTDEQKAALPPEYIGKETGLHPDDAASLFGYESGASMIEHLAEYNRQRAESGKQPLEFKRELIKQETNRRLEARFGKLEENILEAAKEQVLSETQLDLLHEETVALASQAGTQLPLPKDALVKQMQENFAKMPLDAVSSDKLLAAAGKAGREAELALLSGKPSEAFRQKQRQFLAFTMAREAKALEVDRQKFAKLTKRLMPREVKGLDVEFQNQAQALLAQAGFPVRRSLNEIGEAIQADGYRDLSSFVDSKVADGWEMAVNPELAVKPLDEMTVGEYRDFRDAVTSLNHVGREVRKIDIAGEKQDFAEFRTKVLDNIRQLPPRDKNKPARLPWRYDAEVTRMEEIMKDLDLRKELGPLFQGVIRPIMEAKSYEFKLLEKLSDHLADQKGFDKKWQRSLGDTIPQDFFTDPYDGTLFDLTREHMIQIMLNFGNRSNIDKFTRGYAGKDGAAAFEAKLRGLFDAHATKQDWDYVQKIWDTFDEWKVEANRLYRNLSGVAPKWIEHTPVDTPHGQYAGGYYPIIYDKLRSNQGVREERSRPSAGTFDTNYLPATLSNRYTKERTGLAEPIQFQTSIEQVAGRMQQMIHDIAYREAVMQAGKVLYDKEIRGAIRKHYGQEYEAQLHPWLKDVANHFNQQEQKVAFVNAVMRRARMNLMGHALGLNLKVILSPDIGKFSPSDLASFEAARSDNVALAMEKSKEIPHTLRNMDRDFREKLEQTIRSKGFSGVQADAVRWSFAPIAKISQELRMITWTKEYKSALARGVEDSDAVALADSRVRERHGASGVPDLPAIMRSTEAGKLLTTFFGFFNTMYNWQRQMPGQIRRGEWGNAVGTFYGSVLIPAAFGALLFNQQREGDSWFKTIAKAIVLQPLQTMVFAREAANYLVEGFAPRTPVESILGAVGSIVSDAKKLSAGKKVEKPIQHGANVVGLTTGLPLAQIGRTSQFGADVASGAQRPRNIFEWMRGVVTGEARLKK